MKLDELHGRYRHLRSELYEAYAAPEWDSERIDRIADALLPLERALALQGADALVSAEVAAEAASGAQGPSRAAGPAL